MAATFSPRRSDAGSGRPRVSVILPAYRSHRTVGASLDAVLRQEYPRYETILVDSSPDDRTARIAGDREGVRLIRCRDRQLPHDARNIGAAHARGDLFVFSDPDIYPTPHWLSRLVDTHLETNLPVVGSMLSATPDWLAQGTHLVKFDQWLPAPPWRPVTVGLTGNFLIPRALFEKLGGFVPRLMLGDAEFSYRLHRDGYRLTYAPEALVYHHHLSTLAGMLHERYMRGYEYAVLRRKWEFDGRPAGYALWLLLILPLRWMKITHRVGVHAFRAGLAGSFVRTLPLVLAGEAAWLAGEGRHYGRWLSGGKEKDAA